MRIVKLNYFYLQKYLFINLIFYKNFVININFLLMIFNDLERH